MNRLFAAAFLAASFGPSIGSAEPIVVRSGEHESFTRMVMQIPEGVTWELQNEPGNSQLTFVNHDAGFDLSEAFEIIPRTRLTALLAQDSLLEMQLSCDCPVTAFMEQGEFLVIDISDGGDLIPEPPQEVVLARPPVSEFSYGELLWGNNTLRIDPPDPDEGPVAEAASFPDPASENAITEPDLVLETQTRLLEAFSEAASRGLLDPAQPLQNLIPEPEVKEPVVDIFDSSELLDDRSPAAAGNIRVTNSKDVPQDNNIENMALSGSVCIDPKRVDVASWGSEKPFSSQLGLLQRELYDEIGKLRASKAIELAKFYLHYGFGAEARQALFLVPDKMLQFPELLDLASIFEYGFAKNPRILHRYADCNSDVSLWGFLAAQDFPEDYAVDSTAVLRALQNLPSHQRYLFGPEVSNKFLVRGEIENANLALRSFDSLMENEGKPPKIAEAQAKIAAGAELEGRETLSEIIEEDTPDAPEALVSLIQKLADDGQPIPADIALLAESYSFELQNTQMGDKMLRASVLASTSSGQFEKSFAVLKRPDAPFDDTTRAELASHLLMEISKKTSDAELVSVFFGPFLELREIVDHQTRLALAQRLLAAGFIDEADQLSKSLPNAYRSKELNLLRARILFQQRQYRESFREIEGIEDPATAELRGEILERLGENEDAAKFFEVANLPERAASSLWLANDWFDLVDDNTPVFGPISRIRKEEPVQISVDDQMLANTEAALSSSAEVRSTLEQTLQVLQLTEE